MLVNLLLVLQKSDFCFFLGDIVDQDQPKDELSVHDTCSTCA